MSLQSELDALNSGLKQDQTVFQELEEKNLSLKAQLDELKANQNQNQIDSDLAAENEELIKQIEFLKDESEADSVSMAAINEMQLQND